MSRAGVRRLLRVGVPTLVVGFAVGSASAAGQSGPVLRVQAESGAIRPVPVVMDRGYAAAAASALEDLGWSLTWDGDRARFATPGGAAIVLLPSSPLFLLDGEFLQLAFPPFGTGDGLHIPIQLLTDFLPRRYPDRYAFDGPAMMLRAGPPPGSAAPGVAAGVVRASVTEVAPPPEREAPVAAPPPVEQAPVAPLPRTELLADTLTPGRGGALDEEETTEEVPAPDSVPPAAPMALPESPSPYEGPRVVVIDAGHGGYDPGSIGISGVREKNVVLGITLALAEVLRAEPGLEVHLLRDDDTFVEVWDRGQIATDLKGERPGVFISIHANSFPQRRTATGFETYFLSEARTDHERRVAAIENAPMQTGGTGPASAEDLDFILRELRNLDHQHWSALLAEEIQEEVERIHPGPNRGVKQGPLAVITNALMPAVLVEIGYLSNAQEEQLLARPDFQSQAAGAIAKAVLRFFERYPPGSASGGDGASR